MVWLFSREGTFQPNVADVERGVQAGTVALLLDARGGTERGVVGQQLDVDLVRDLHAVLFLGAEDLHKHHMGVAGVAVVQLVAAADKGA